MNSHLSPIVVVMYGEQNGNVIMCLHVTHISQPLLCNCKLLQNVFMHEAHMIIVQSVRQNNYSATSCLPIKNVAVNFTLLYPINSGLLKELVSNSFTCQCNINAFVADQ